MRIKRYLVFNTLHAPISSSKTSLSYSTILIFSIFISECLTSSSDFYEMHRVAAFLLPSAFIIRCRATRRDECLLPVIYRSLFLLVTHLRSSRRVFPFPLSVRAFRLPGASPDGRTNQLPGWGTLSA